MKKPIKKMTEGYQGILLFVKKGLKDIAAENGGDESLIPKAAEIIANWYRNEGMTEKELRADDFWLEGDIIALLDAASDPEEARIVRAVMGIEEDEEDEDEEELEEAQVKAIYAQQSQKESLKPYLQQIEKAYVMAKHLSEKGYSVYKIQEYLQQQFPELDEDSIGDVIAACKKI